MSDKKQEVATIGSSVTDAMDAIREELKGLKEITETQYKTGGDGRVDGFPKPIQEETDIQTLVKMHSSVHGRSNAYDASTAVLAGLVGGNFAVPVFKLNGATFENLQDDIVLRIKVLSVQERKNELEKLLNEAQGFMTKEDSFKMFQKKLASFVKGKAVEAEA